MALDARSRENLAAMRKDENNDVDSKLGVILGNLNGPGV